MIIEGPMLLGVLIIVALAIAALLVYIRFAVRKEDPEAESLFSRLLKFGAKDEEEGEEDGQETAAQPADGGLTLPGMSPIGGGASPEPPKKKEKKMPGIPAGGLFSGLFGGRKSKEKIKEEVQAIDEQLNSVLQQSSEISVPGLQPEIGALEIPLSDGRGMRELDLAMGALNEPGMMPPMDAPIDVQNPIMAPAVAHQAEEKPGGADNGPDGSETFARYFDADAGQVRDAVSEARRIRMAMGKPVVAPTGASADSPADTGLNVPVTTAEAGTKKPNAPQAPPKAEPSKPPADNFMQETRSSGNDLLDDLESEAKQEVLIDMSIMKEYQDMPITSVELESDLKGILDQITINMHGKGKQQV